LQVNTRAPRIAAINDLDTTRSIGEDSLVKAYFKSLLALLLLLTLGCVTPVTPEQIASADYGTVPVSPTYQNAIKHFMQPLLFDPFAARFRFVGEPQKGYAYLSGRRKPPEFGYLVHVGINAKNLMGNYVGEEPYRFFIKNDMLYPLSKSDKAEVVP
jgi:hypothetical protein